MKIVFATGGSGGHVVPALQVAEVLRRKGHDVFFVGSFARESIRQLIESRNFSLYSLMIRQIRLSTMPYFIVSFFQSLFFLLKFRAHCVVGFGGFASLPTVAAAILWRCPTMIHEQNVVPGKANAVLGRWVSRIAVSFPETLKFFPRKKTVWTGCPCHISTMEASSKKVKKNIWGLRKDKKTLLVLGGSLGSRRINDVFIEMLQAMRDRNDFQVIHIAGKKDYDKLKKVYARLNIPVALFMFLEMMSEAYQQADVVIARAGAVTVTELALSRCSAVLIPYPYAAGHQKYNARVLQSTHNAQIIEESCLTSQSLKQAIFKSLTIQKKYKGQIYLADAAERLAGRIMEMAR